MTTPCRKCGATRIDSIYPGLRYRLAKKVGYRLCMCGNCHRLRLFKRREEKNPLGDPPEAPPACEPASAPAPEKPQTPVQPPQGPACPNCGGLDLRRTKRVWWEKILQRPPMARCRACRRRFPLPEDAIII